MEVQGEAFGCGQVQDEARGCKEVLEDLGRFRIMT